MPFDTDERKEMKPHTTIKCSRPRSSAADLQRYMENKNINLIGRILIAYGILKLIFTIFNVFIGIPSVRFSTAGNTSDLYNIMFLGASVSFLFSIYYICFGIYKYPHNVRLCRVDFKPPKFGRRICYDRLIFWLNQCGFVQQGI